MMILLTRDAQPDAPYWVGRGVLGALDALAWPALWIALAWQLPQRGGVIGAVVTGLAVLSAIRRLHTAVCENHRYQFTTWKVGKVVFAVWLVGLVMKLTTMLPQ